MLARDILGASREDAVGGAIVGPSTGEEWREAGIVVFCQIKTPIRHVNQLEGCLSALLLISDFENVCTLVFQRVFAHLLEEMSPPCPSFFLREAI